MFVLAGPRKRGCHFVKEEPPISWRVSEQRLAALEQA
jgi:hypothetical protein